MEALFQNLFWTLVCHCIGQKIPVKIETSQRDCHGTVLFDTAPALLATGALFTAATYSRLEALNPVKNS